MTTASNPTAGEDRLPPLREDQLSAEQRAALAEITAGPRGGLIGPFVVTLRSPELMTRLQKTGEYLRFGSNLPADVFELCILLVARRWTQQFEWAFHRPLALDAGVPAAAVTAIALNQRPETLNEACDAVWDLVDDLHRTRRVADSHYARVVDHLGEVGVVEVTTTVGYYTTLAMIMNMAQTPPPSTATDLLPNLPDIP
jgi:4-carboxymuconolactone decarboxylase